MEKQLIISQQIKNILKNKNLSVSKLALMSGVSYNCVSSIVHDQTTDKVRVSTIDYIASGLKIPLEFILFGEEPENNDVVRCRKGIVIGEMIDYFVLENNTNIADLAKEVGIPTDMILNIKFRNDLSLRNLIRLLDVTGYSVGKLVYGDEVLESFLKSKNSKEKKVENTPYNKFLFRWRISSSTKRFREK